VGEGNNRRLAAPVVLYEPIAHAGEIIFAVRKCDNAKMPERFLFPVYVKPR